MKYPNKKPINYLMCYPRSGSSLLRFYLEFITGKRAIDSDSPMYKKFIMHNETILVKNHFLRQRDIYENDKIILLQRNYIMSCTSHIFRDTDKTENIPLYLKEQMSDLEYFDRSKNKKLIIYYEDFMWDKVGTMKNVLDFLEIGYSYNKFEDFKNNIEELDKTSMSLYTRVQHKFDYKKLQKDHLTSENIIKYKNIMKSYNPKLYEKYLSRY